jgi:hypothetical protein
MGATVNFKEGTRRLALFLGVVGAILGCFASYLELQSFLNQRTRYNRFEQLAASDVVQQERKCRLLDHPGGCVQMKLPPGYALDKPKQGKYTDADIAEPSQTDDFADIAKPLPTGVPPKFSAAEMEDSVPLSSKVNAEGIKTINWSKGMSYGVESIDTEDGQTLYPTPAPNRWLYLFAAILPALGFALPWGLIRAVRWVGAGYFATTQ